MYTFADCYRCKKTGHLSRDCPNKDRGVYRKSQEKTHSAKDFPKRMEKYVDPKASEMKNNEYDLLQRLLSDLDETFKKRV